MIERLCECVQICTTDIFTTDIYYTSPSFRFPQPRLPLGGGGGGVITKSFRLESFLHLSLLLPRCIALTTI